jgi:ribosomal protein S18 acetylase RimI-like enzyme
MPQVTHVTEDGADAGTVHRALVSSWARIYGAVPGATFEESDDLIRLSCPVFPIPQCNGAWVMVDSERAVAALPEAVAAVEEAGLAPWVQTRSGQERAQAAARSLGLTHVERVPGMAARPEELGAVATDLEIRLINDTETEDGTDLLSVAFGAPKELFVRFGEVFRALAGISWYVGRIDGIVVSTALAFEIDHVVGIFNVATSPEHRRRGHGAALTARAAQDGFARGCELAYLQSSELGYGVYRKLGFRDVEEYLLFTRPPA